jgi:fumarate reductase flavoprotein subunit
VRPFGGMKVERTWYAADKTGFHILHTLFQTSLKYPSIRRFDEYYSTDLIVEDGRCTGVVAIEMRSGRMVAFRAKAVVIATGGAGRIFPFTTNGAIKTGDGMAMAYRAGVPLKDMEFMQYHPTGLPGTGILITEGSRGEGGILVNKDGYRYLQDYNLGPPDPWPRKKAMELGPRDRLSQAFWHEQQKGRTIKTPHGDVVHLDIRQLGEKKINERLPMVRELAMAYVGVDPVHAMIPVRPVVHYTMGGIHTDIDAATPLPGLFAAGECACVSINGANRLGSNSLAEIVVFGARAGRGAAAFAKANRANPMPASAGTAAEAAQARLRELFAREGGGDSVSSLRKAMNDTMESGAGIYRTEQTLQETCGILADLRARYRKMPLQDRSNVFNTDLIQALELGCMLDVASAMAQSALQRKESRGSHQRLEYPDRDDANYLKHSMASYRGDAAPSISYRDVVITRSQPAERVYGGAAT